MALSKKQLAAFPTITLSQVNADMSVGPRFGPEAQVGWLCALNKDGKAFMCVANRKAGLGIFFQNVHIENSVRIIVEG